MNLLRLCKWRDISEEEIIAWFLPHERGRIKVKVGERKERKLWEKIAWECNDLKSFRAEEDVARESE